MSVLVVSTANDGFRTEWEALTPWKMTIIIGAGLWSLFLAAMVLYNYLAIRAPPPALSFEDQIGVDEKGIVKSNRSPKTERSVHTAKSGTTQNLSLSTEKG